MALKYHSEAKAIKRIVFWGTYDVGKPRVRLLLQGAKTLGLEVIECHRDIWQGIVDKSQLRRKADKLRLFFSLILAYPALIWKYLTLPSHEAVIVGYMGQIDVLLLWPFARMKGIPIVWDAFLSLYDTMVYDRGLVSRFSPLAKILYLGEWLACRAADKIFLDTYAHARFFEETFSLPSGSVARVFVGAETDIFSSEPISPGRRKTRGQQFNILFYGQFIPLHGIETIVKAAYLVEKIDSNVRWLIVGRGQQNEIIDKMVRILQLRSIKRISWVPYKELVNLIKQADLCLGIFGTSEKALRVIPNKVYQILAAQQRLVTSNTPAIIELIGKEQKEGIYLVPPGDPEALATTILTIKNKDNKKDSKKLYSYLELKIGPKEVGSQLHEVLTSLECKR